MSGYFVRRLVTRTSQPQGVVGLDKNHRLYKDLVGVLLPDVPINLVDGAPLQYGAATTRSAGAAGKALEVADGAQGGVYFTSPRLTSAMTLMTMVTRIELLSNPSASRRQFICIGDSWNAPYDNNVIDFSNDPQLTVNVNAPYGQYPVPLKKPQTIGASFRGAGGTSLWIDGKFDAASGAATNVRNTQGRAGWLNLSYSLTANRAPPVKGYIALYFDVALSDADMKDVTANPWQFFEPEEIEEWVSTSAGGSTLTLITSLSAAIQAAHAATASVAAAIQSERTAAASANAAIQIARNAQATVDAALQAALSGSATVDAYIQAGYTASAQVSGAIQVTHTGSASLDAAIQRALTATATLGAAVQASAAASATLTAYIQAGTTASATVDAAVQAAQSASAALSAAIATARSASASLGAAIAVQMSVSAAMSAAVQASGVATASVGAYVVDDSMVVLGSLVGSIRRAGATRANVQTAVRSSNRQTGQR